MFDEFSKVTLCFTARIMQNKKAACDGSFRIKSNFNLVYIWLYQKMCIQGFCIVNSTYLHIMLVEDRHYLAGNGVFLIRP